MLNLGKKAVLDLTIPFVKNHLPEKASSFITKATSNAIIHFERKISGQGAVRAGKGFSLLISNKDIYG